MRNTKSDLFALRKLMVEKLKSQKAIRSLKVEDAFLKVPRHYFLEDVISAREAYQDSAVNLKWGISTSSQPRVMALMLEALKPFPGMYVLEVGTAAGYNAALLAHIAGNEGRVISLELEEDLALRAEEKLKTLYGDRVEVHVQNGWHGYKPYAPYDRMIITCEASEISPSLFNQLKERGIMVLPFKVDPDLTMMVSLQKKNCNLQGNFFGFPVSFVPMRGQKKEGNKKEVAFSELIFSGLSWRMWRLTVNEQIGLILFQKATKMTDARQVYKKWIEKGSPGPEDFIIIFEPGKGLIIKMRTDKVEFS